MKLILSHINKFYTVLILLFFSITQLNAQLYPEYDVPKPRKKKQKEIPRFPPQFHSKDTIAKKDSIIKTLPPGVDKNFGKVIKRSSQAPAVRTDSFAKLISEKTDANGNITRIMEITVGKKKTRQTTLVAGKQLNKPFNADTIDKDSITIQIVKKNYRMYIYHKHKFLTAYKCVFGPPYLEQKQKEGDRRTPEGWFKILEIRPHKEWNTFMLIDYPNEESYQFFEANKRNGFISKEDKIGGAIGIHGVWEGADDAVDLKKNWTDGCISLKIADLEELKRIIQVGTPIYIKRTP